MKKSILALLASILLFALTFTAVTSASLPFDDIKDGKWYTKAVEFCYENGYMSGTSETTFSPNLDLSRGMVVTILAAIEGIDKAEYAGKTSFTDVKAGKWYSAPIEWAYRNGVVAGYGDQFKPENSITREELAVLLLAYARYSGIDDSARENDLGARFSDVPSISKWAKTAISWAVASGLISGTPQGTVNPKGTATRAETAVMIYKFCKLGPQMSGTFTVSRAFGDHMTVQRDKQFSVWGWAEESDEGRTVEVEFKGRTASAVVTNGEWKAVFEGTFPASAEPAVLTVKGAGKTVTFEDVLVGDVYYVMGQSNVYWPMQMVVDDLRINGLLSEVEDLTYDASTNIRLFRNSHVFQAGKTGEDAWGTTKLYKDVDSELAVWARPDDFDSTKAFDQNTEFIGGRSFSAIGYLFALNLSKQTDVPIAMIEIDASGYALTAWAPNELADKWGSDVADENGVHWMQLGGTVYPLHSRMAYNQQLYPLINFSCAGILWYQGESDMLNTIYNYGKEAWTFSNEVADLMQYFRSHMGSGDDNFPVYFVEFPACFQYNANSAYLMTGIVRSELGSVPRILDNSYVVPSSDLWDNFVWQNNIHPYCKPAQARRAADMVLANEYGKGNIDYLAGPQLDTVEYTDRYTAELTFKYVGDGLEVFSEDFSGDVYGVEVLISAATNINWVKPAEITVDGNKLTVKHNMPIYGVRYDAVTESYYPVSANLSNSEGVPMVAFADYR